MQTKFQIKKSFQIFKSPKYYKNFKLANQSFSPKKLFNPQLSLLINTKQSAYPIK